MPDSFAVLAGGLDHPEGVAWDPLTERVYAGGEAGQIYAIGLDGTMTTVAVTGGFVLGLAVDGRGLVYACDVGRGEVVRVDPSTGVVAPYASGTGADRMAAPNWLAFDDSGSLYVTDSGDWKKRNGRIWKVAPGGVAEVWTTGAKRLPNGCCMSASGDALFVVETNVPGITRIPICPDGTAGKAERWLDLPGTVPDGVAATADGGLLIACYRPDAVLRMRPDRSVETLVEDPDGQLLGAPANVAFVGSKLDRLVTSNLGRWHVAIGDPGVHGAPLPRPVID
ncbi:MAG: SMP-30/gluconolactonase/LRE family protein [Chloroflexota bacterium]